MIIKSQSELVEACEKWASADFVAMDTEFLREKTYYAKLCLIQIASCDGLAKAIDPLSDWIDLSPVIELLLNENVVKVFHAASQDLEIFYKLCGKKLPSPVFDTQIASMVLGYGEQIGYEAIVNRVTGEQIDKSSQFTDWSRRPLTQKQLEYAIGDVTHLCNVYKALSAELDEKQRRDWISREEETLNNPSSYDADAENAWLRVKIRNPKPKNLIVLKHLAAWREEYARMKDKPKSWIMRDEVLAEFATRLPKSLSDVEAMRGVPPNIKNSSKAKTALDIIEKALKVPQDQWPIRKKKKPLSQEAMEKLELFKMLHKIHAAKLGVAPKLLASSDDLNNLAMYGRKAQIPLLCGWRLEASGNEMLDLADGKVSIGIKDNKVKAISR